MLHLEPRQQGSVTVEPRAASCQRLHLPPLQVFVAAYLSFIELFAATSTRAGLSFR